jgi:hypothetical protein
MWRIFAANQKTQNKASHPMTARRQFQVDSER